MLNLSPKVSYLYPICFIHCKLTFSIINTLKSFIKRGKDKLELLSNQNVLYKISCDNYETMPNKKKIKYENTWTYFRYQ